jgi:hypothetical protein
MKTTRGHATAALVLALALVPARAVHADNQSQREALMTEINALLGEMRSKLDAVPGSSSTYEIDDARDKANQVKRKAQDLQNVKEGDSTADRMSSYYPGYADRFRESADYLKSMKDAWLRQADARLWEKCQDADRKLRDDVSRFLDKNDPRGLTEIPRLAEEAQRQLQGPLGKADETHKQMEGWKGYARNFSESDGEWSGVSSELREAADGIWERWKERHEAIHLKCDDLAKGKYHPFVVAALEKLADSDKSRASLYERLDKSLGEAASYLSGIAGRSGLSELDNAVGLSDQLLATLETLKNARGEDEKAKRISDAWPDKVKEYRRAVEVLRLAKAQQFVIDRAPEVCKNADAELGALIQKYVGSPELADEGLQVINERAEKLGGEYRGRLEAAEKKREELERYRDEAMRFGFDEGAWRPVKENLHEGAKGIYGYYKGKLDEARSACGNLALGLANPVVQDGLKRLGDTTKNAVAELEAVKSDYEAWKRDRSSGFLQYYHDDTYAIRDAFCNYDGDDPDKFKRVMDDIASRSQNRLQTSFDDLERRATELIARLDRIKGDTSISGKERSALRSKIVAALARLQKSKGKGLMRGMNDPKVRARVEYGKTAHKSKQDSCDAKEVVIEGKRIDCVKVSSHVCRVIEIKPENPGAIAHGHDQVEGYLHQLESLLASGGVDAFGSGDLRIFKQCMWVPTQQEAAEGKKPRLDLTTAVETYDYCPSVDEVVEVQPEAGGE